VSEVVVETIVPNLAGDGRKQGGIGFRQADVRSVGEKPGEATFESVARLAILICIRHG
jgi:hypothetical protein